jgi:hypothetical protein
MLHFCLCFWRYTDVFSHELYLDCLGPIGGRLCASDILREHLRLCSYHPDFHQRLFASGKREVFL